MKRLNKKGFTLVELLAVIVVLALLMVVATSSIGTALTNAKKSATRTEAQKLLSSLYAQEKAETLTKATYTAKPGTAEYSEGTDFKYKYKTVAGPKISAFCLKHTEGYWVTGFTDENGKVTVSDVLTSKPAGVCTVIAKTTQADCTSNSGTWTAISCSN